MEFDKVINSVDVINDGHLKECLSILKANEATVPPECISLLEECVGNLADVAYCLEEYIEPWQCPNCSAIYKIPPDPSKKRHCVKCKGNDCFPYVYIQQEMLNNRMKVLLPCVQYYSQQANGDVAQQALLAIGTVKNTPEKS